MLIKVRMVTNGLFLTIGIMIRGSNSRHKVWLKVFMMISLEIKNIATITFEGIDYYCVIHDVSKSDAISLLKGSVLDDKAYINKCFSKEIMSRKVTATIKVISSK